MIVPASMLLSSPPIPDLSYSMESKKLNFKKIKQIQEHRKASRVSPRG
jgi:hypothetical protein